MKITSIHARQILDSRGFPTVEADVVVDDKFLGRAAVPSGASTGTHEALELRDGDSANYLGKSVNQAVANVNTKISPLLLGQDANDQGSLDHQMIKLDGTPNKANLGANAILSVSMAAARAAAKSQGLKLFQYLNYFLDSASPAQAFKNNGQFVFPVPFMNVINGGKHAIGGVDFQEFMIVPHGFSTFTQGLQAGVTVFHHLKKILHDNNLPTLVGDEGGFAPAFSRNDKPLEFLMQAIQSAGYEPGRQVSIGLDPAISELYQDGVYNLSRENRSLYRDQLIEYWLDLANRFPIVSLEDGLDQDDWDGWQNLTSRISSIAQTVGDDFLVTNPARLQKSIDMHAATAILVKVNQIGSLTEAIQAINLATTNHMNAMVSHRSGETEDSFIADLVVGLSTGQIKTGSASRSDRIAKYNQLLRIEELLGDKAIYAGTQWTNGKPF